MKLVESEYFNSFIMLSIFLNSVLIAAYDHSQKHKRFNFVLNYLSIAFTAIYSCECLMKIVANGLIIG